MLVLSDMPFIKYEARTKVQSTLHDDIVSHHQNGRIVTFKSWPCLQYYVHKNDRKGKKLQSKSVFKLWVFSNNQGIRRDASEVIMTKQHN